MLVYFAAPLFNAAERHFNHELTLQLEALNFTVFLPQRDGAERDKPPHNTMSRDERRQAMFHLDKTKIWECDIFLFVLDGRVPDEGACVELGLAYAQKVLQNQPKYLIGLHTDARAAFLMAKLNPMLRVPLEDIVDNVSSLLEAVQQYRVLLQRSDA